MTAFTSLPPFFSRTYDGFKNHAKFKIRPTSIISARALAPTFLSRSSLKLCNIVLFFATLPNYDLNQSTQPKNIVIIILWFPKEGCKS